MKKAFMVLLAFFCFFSIANAKIYHSKRNAAPDNPCSCSIGANTVTSAMNKITLTQAKALVMAALRPDEKRAPGLAFDMGEGHDPNKISTYIDLDNPRFLIFHVVWATTEGSDLIGFYNVDAYTGDVFSATGQTCNGIQNKKLAALQKRVRRSLRLSDAQYRKLKTAGALCDPD